MLNINTETDGSEYILRLTGRLDVNAAEDVDRKFTEISTKADKITLDLDQLEYVSSAGLRAIRKLLHNMKKKGRTVSFRKIRQDIMDIFEMTGFAAMMHIED